MSLTHRPATESDIQIICGLPQTADELFHLFPMAEAPLTPSRLRAAITQRADSSVVELDGAASAIDRQLGGDGDIEETLLRDGWLTSPHLDADKTFNRRPRILPRLLPAPKRKGWEEIEFRFPDTDARAEGSRCLKCNLPTEMAPPVTPPAV